MSTAPCNMDAVVTAVAGAGAIDCAGDSSGYSFRALLQPPSAIQMAKICKSARCMDVLAALKTAQPTECTVSSGFALYKQVINPIDAVCAANQSAASSTGPATTPARPVMTPTPAPTPTEGNQTGLSSAAIVGIAGGGVVVLLLIVVNVVLFRRRRSVGQQENTAPTSGAGKPASTDRGFAYADLSDAPTANTGDEADVVSGGRLALAAVRIPPANLRLGDVISQGGFGEVLRGLYRGEVVAVKRLLASRSHDTNSVASFFKEIELTATLDHECIVQFIGVSWDGPANLTMVSEFMHGGDLRSLLVQYAKDGHPNGHEDAKLRMAVQVAHALTYLHSLDTPVVHRDLKSRNILLTESMDAKLIDFGISCERQDVTMTAGVGTSLWMAPEVVMGKRYDEKADVFSFGVILSELDTHELPYDHAIDPGSGRKMVDMVLMNLICAGQLKPRFTDKAHPEMVTLATDCLQLDPAKRPFASEVLYRIHRNIQHDRTLTAETRAVITRSLHTAETSTRTRTRGTPLK